MIGGGGWTVCDRGRGWMRKSRSERPRRRMLCFLEMPSRNVLPGGMEVEVFDSMANR